MCSRKFAVASEQHKNYRNALFRHEIICHTKLERKTHIKYLIINARYVFIHLLAPLKLNFCTKCFFFSLSTSRRWHGTKDARCVLNFSSFSVNEFVKSGVGSVWRKTFAGFLGGGSLYEENSYLNFKYGRRRKKFRPVSSLPSNFIPLQFSHHHVHYCRLNCWTLNRKFVKY